MVEELNNKSLTDEIITMKQNGKLIPFSFSNSMNFQNEDREKLLNEQDKIEQEFYGAPISTISYELFRDFEDIMKNVILNLEKELYPILIKNFNEEEVNKIISNFSNSFLKDIFIVYLDKGELKMKDFLKFPEIEKEYEDYIINKKKIPNEKLIENQTHEIDKLFNKEKIEYYELMKEDLKLRIDIQVQEFINSYRSNLFIKNINDNIDSQIKLINQKIEEKPNFEIMNNNLQFIEQQLKEFTTIINNF